MKIDLGFMKIPLEGPMSHIPLVLGIVWGCAWNCIVLAISSVKGPAINAPDGPSFTNAVSNTIIVTCMWSILYLNYIGVAVLSIFTRSVWEMYTDKDVTDKQVPNASRFSGNMFEQSPIFLTGLWMYTVFADYETGWTLGVLYLVAMTYYPFHYMIFRQFTFWFENCTQMRYGVNGIFILGSACQASGMQWAPWLNSNPVGAGILGFMVGSFAFVPGIPLTPLYTFLHYKFDHAAKLKELAAASAPVISQGQQDNA